ncbi:2-hydroxyacyl-CoA dehydratase [Peptoclostridium acidaminophilum]|nr:2-hydroxyacyl-CoA dehydratase [Peptoclostridium acidaminophilum]
MKFSHMAVISMRKILNVGVDIGSTTVKLVILDRKGEIVFSRYRRHLANIKDTLTNILDEAYQVIGNKTMTIAMTGSGGMRIAQAMNVAFVQEVIASTKSVEASIPYADVAIELGGEDAKITYFEGSIEQRMNGICAGGTGAFIDQMATLLKTDAMGLNELSSRSSNSYCIAARCGVFAKTDIQALMNDGTRREDIAASVFKAVAEQTITSLSCGKRIKGNVVLLGGPFHFLSELTKSFTRALGDGVTSVAVPENSNLFVAMGAALLSENEIPVNFIDIKHELMRAWNVESEELKSMPVLFANEAELMEFQEKNCAALPSEVSVKGFSGGCYLGIDSGSTTTKVVLIDQDARIVYSYYGNNLGTPLDTAKNVLIRIHKAFGDDIKIIGSAVTGYGEKLIQNAFDLDLGEVETVAHYKAAAHFEPNVDTIIDIGGQDMKCIRIKNKAIDSIMLNEACSSGCGSFIETFAKSLDMTMVEFVEKALKSKAPVDLGSRCTVFMNSRVKQAQKEGADVGDICAGLSYAVVKNALYKVIKLKDAESLGAHIVVQGGTFYNDAVLRCFEILTSKKVVRPPISGIMGAFGAALIAREKCSPESVSRMIKLENMEDFSFDVKAKKCPGCTNSCMLTINRFSDGKIFISGNRCEKGAGEEEKKTEGTNIYRYKYERIFAYTPRKAENARYGTIGIPRVLNMFENYPFWFTFFDELGFRVSLSDETTMDTYKLGMDTIASETVCYPAKLVHGHIAQLLNSGVKRIFYPCIMHEVKECSSADNHYNCPVVTSYPELVKMNMDGLMGYGVDFMNPFVPYADKKKLAIAMHEELRYLGIKYYQVRRAIRKAEAEDKRVKEDIRGMGKRVLEHIGRTGGKGIVLAGRPYHLDPGINRGIDRIITLLGMAVLTEDSVAHLAGFDEKLNVVDQWMYHSRLYRAASYVCSRKDIELVQLNSFGCGIDSITSDQVEEILKSGGKLYTVLKVDEVVNTGAVKIRLRSLCAAMKERDKQPKLAGSFGSGYRQDSRPVFTEQMRRSHTILCPQMSPVHFSFVQAAFGSEGYKLEVLRNMEHKIVETGLKYVNNDACYPALIVIGQIIDALNSGKYDIDTTAVIISQTGGGCRATNYISLLKKALSDAGYGKTPVLSLNALGMEKQPGFRLKPSLVKKLAYGIMYADLISSLALRTRPYEKISGAANMLYEKWIGLCTQTHAMSRFSEFKRNIRSMVSEFEHVEIHEKSIPRVGVVGEILVNYHPLANNGLVELLEREGAEAVLPNLTDFMLYSLYNSVYRSRKLSGGMVSRMKANAAISIIEAARDQVRSCLKGSKRFDAPLDIYSIAKKASEIVSLGNQTGEGWLLTGEIVKLVESGVNNVLCLQPFGCLPNHIAGKGVMKELKRRYSNLNIYAVDYDPGASEVNQLNRIKLMLSNSMNASNFRNKGDMPGRKQPRCMRISL